MASKDQAYEFVMGFIATSDKYKKQFTEAQEEVMQNFMVKLDYEPIARERSPYRNQPIYRSHRRQVMLKDNETHKVVTTYAAKLMRALFGDTHSEYVRAQPVGYEDADKARTVTALLRYVFTREGHYRTFYETIIDMLVFGTSIVECSWKYEERSVLARSLSVDPMTGETIDKVERISGYPVYDDVCLRNVDPMDFYPDPSRYRLHEMSGCAKRFRMNAAEARRTGIYKQSKVEEAIAKGGTGVASGNAENFRRGLDQPMETAAIDGAKEMIGYEYWGDIPEELSVFDSTTGKMINTDRGVITVLNGIVVRADAWPLADYCLPFTAFIINPMNGRFYGLSPAETIRYDQSFADAVKILLAEAIVRRVHPPIAFDPDADVDISKIKIWKSDALIAAKGGPNAIGTVRYDADINGGFNLLAGLKAGMQEGSGALGAIQGESGPDRESASVGSQRLQFAMDRPEMAAMLIENEPLPSVAKQSIRRCQQFVHDDADLQRRVGEMPHPVWLGDIMGDYDVFFSGSRKTMNRQQKLQAFDRMTSSAQVMPALQMLLPTPEIAQFLVGDLLELQDVALKIGDPQTMQANMLAMQMQGGGGPAGNGVPTMGQPAGMLPEQAAGGVV